MAHESEPTADSPHPGPPDRTGDLHDAPTRSAAPQRHHAGAAFCPPLPRGAVFGHYTIEAVLGEGGMGVVYRARQERPAREVALKVIRPGLASSQALRRFELEAEVLGRLQHPGIAQVFEAGTTPEGQPFFAMELVRGESLIRYADLQSLTTRERLELFAKVCDAVQHAHTKGVIHRDLKPVNILVDSTGQPKILDFGVARVTQHDVQAVTIQTDLGQIIGTVPYMSPEQIEGDPANLDTRSDVYALGVILYELLSGRMPYDLSKKLIHEAARIIQEDEPTRLSSINRALRGDIETIALKALEKDKARRYQAASDLGSDITRFLRDEPIVARPASRRYQLRKFAQRNKALVGGVVAAFVLLASGLAGTSCGLVRAEEQRRIAHENELRAQSEAARAIAAEAETKQRADELQKVSDFQSNMLAQIDPTTAGVRLTEDVNQRFEAALEKMGVPESEVTQRAGAFRQEWLRVNATDAALALIDETILKPAVKAIDDQFKDQPAIDARMKISLAGVYRRVGYWQESAALLTEAIEQVRRAKGEQSQEALEAISKKGVILKELGELELAEQHLRDALEGLRARLGEGHSITLSTWISLGWALEGRGKTVEAEQCYRNALERCRRSLGDDDEVTLGAMNNLSYMLVTLGRFDEAEPLSLEVVERRRRVLGPEHPETLNALNNHGQLLQDMGRFAEAEASLSETLRARRHVLGNDHPSTLVSVDNMSRVLQAQGRFSEAEPLAWEALEAGRRTLGDDHPDTLVSMNNMSVLLNAQGKKAEATAMMALVVEGLHRSVGPAHIHSVMSSSNYGRALVDLGRFEEAEPYLVGALAKLREMFGDAHLMVPVTATTLGMLMNKTQRFDEAIALLEPIEDTARSVLSGDHARRLAVLLIELGRARSALPFEPQRFTLAESNLLEGHSILLKCCANTHLPASGCVGSLADFYTTWHTAEPNKGYDLKAAEWRAKLEPPAPGAAEKSGS